MSENDISFNFLEIFLKKLEQIKDENNLFDFTDLLLKNLFFISQSIDIKKSININKLVIKNISSLFHKSKKLFLFDKIANKSLQFFKEKLTDKDVFDRFKIYLNFFYTVISFNNTYIEILNSLNVQINDFNSNIAKNNKIDKYYFINLSEKYSNIAHYVAFHPAKPAINSDVLYIKSLKAADAEMRALEQ